MNEIKYILIADYKNVRKIKYFQNLLLLLFGIFTILSFILIIFDPTFSLTITIIITSIGFFCFVLFTLLSVLFYISFINKNIEKVFIKNEFLLFKGKSYPLKSIQWLINIETRDWNNKKIPTKEKLITLPQWGNFIFIDDQKLEFIPSSFLYNNIESINITTYDHIPILQSKTSKLFSEVMSAVWVIS